MKTARWLGLLDNVTAAALYDWIKPHLKEVLWLALPLTVLIAVAAIFGRRKPANKETSHTSPSSSRAFRESLGVYMGQDSVEHYQKSSCTVHAPGVPVKLTIRGASVNYCLLPLLAEIDGRTGVVLYSFQGGAAHAISAECTDATAFNAIPNGAYDIQLDLPGGPVERWTLEIGYGGPPAVKRVCYDRPMKETDREKVGGADRSRTDE